MVKWTKAMTATAVEMRNAGHTYPEIAAVLGITANSVKTKCIDHPGVVKRNRNTPRIWGPQELEQLSNLFHQGLTCQAIADAMGKSLFQVRGALRRAGLRRYEKVPEWTPAEEEALMQLLDTSSMSIQENAVYWQKHHRTKGWQPRSFSAIQMRLCALKVSVDLKERGRFTTPPQLALALDISPNVIYRWIKRGDLKVQRIGPHETKQYIRLRNFVGFVLDNYGEVADLLQPPQFHWLLSLMADYCRLRKEAMTQKGTLSQND